MKTSPRSLFRRPLWLVILAFVLGIFTASSARAGLSLEMNLVRDNYYNYYYFSPNLGTNSAAPSVPFGDYYITSSGYPTNGTSAFYNYDTNGFNQIGGGSYGYGDFDGMMHELTNSAWSIYVTNSVTTNVYHFTVTPNIVSNDLPLVSITFPANGAVNVTDQPTYAWQGPTNYSGLVVYGYNFDNNLPVTQTSFQNPNVLYQGINSFTAHYDSNSTTAVVSSVPTNSSGPIFSWASTAHLQDFASSQFTVGTADPSGTSHTLVAHYAWDGTNANGSASGKDTSGHGYDMDFSGSFGGQGGVNSTTDPAAGPRAIQFHDGDGNSAGYAGWNSTPPNLLAALAGSFSISCWIKTTQNNFGGDQDFAYYGAGIISADNGGQANDLIPLALTGSKIGFNTGGDNGDVTVNSVTPVNDGNYHHIVVTRNQQTGRKVIYIDGVLDSFGSGSTNLLNDPQKLTIGALADASDPSAVNFSYYNGYDGELDDVQIYSGVLSSNEVAQLYLNPGSTADQIVIVPLVGRYNFEDTNSPGTDTSGNGNDANCSSGTGNPNPSLDTFSTDAAVGLFAREWFGDTSICFYPNGNMAFNNLSNALRGNFSWTAWVKTTNSVNDDFANAFYGAPILFEYADGVNQAVFSITGSKAAFTIGNPNGGSDTILHSTTSVNDGSYHFLAATRNATTGVMKVYVDGNLEATGTSTNGPRIASATMHLAGGDYTFFKGLIDDVRVYGDELSATDMAALSGHPLGGNGGGHKNVAHYAFDNSGNLGQDSSGNGNDMAGVPVTWGPPYQFNPDAKAGGGAVRFFGTSALFASDQTMTNLNAVLAGSFTCSTWVKTTVTNGSDYNNAFYGATIFFANNYLQGDTNDTIPLSITGSKAAFTTRGGNPGASDNLHSTTSVNDGSYHLITVTREQSTGEKKIYVDGNFEASEFSTTAPLNGNNYNITIGGYAFCTDGGCTNFYAYEGLLDDFQIYSGVLDATEVAYLYNNPGSTVADITGGGGAGTLADAVDATNLVWTTGGNAVWTSQTAITHDGVDAARSGPLSIGHFQNSDLTTIVTGPGTLTFWWRNVVNDDSLYMDFYIDGNYQNEIYGQGGWEQDGPYTLGPGTHTLGWTAYDDGTLDPNAAGFLDEVSFVATPPPNTNSAPVITVNPFSQTNYPGYTVALYAAATSNPTATWQWFKVGSGLIAGATTNLYIPTNSGTAGVAGNYFAIAANTFGSATTLVANVTFQSAPLPPDWSTAFKSFLLGSFQERRTNYGICFLLDSSNNLYSANSYTGTNTFAADTLIAGPGKFGTALMKQTISGTTLWARGLTNTGNGNSYPQSIAPAPGGGVYLSGVFTGTNGLGTNILAETANGTTYLARFDAAGNVLWVRTIAGTNSNFQSYHQLVADPAGNVTISALIQDTVSLGTTNIVGAGQRGLLVQYDAGGNLRWAQVPSVWADYLAYSAGRIYGSMGGGSTNFIGGITNTSDRQYALFSLNATNGQALWLRNIAAAQGQSAHADAPAVSISGTNVFVTGSAGGSNAMFGALSVSWPDDVGQYFARYDTNGNAQIATAFGSPTTTTWAAVADASGNVYVGADFDTYSTFGDKVISGPHKEAIADSFYSHMFVAKFDRNGNALWARTAQSPNYYVNLRDLALASDGIWSYGFVMQFANFGTNQVFGTPFIISSELQYLIGGVFGKITDATAIPIPVTLLTPANSGGNFSFTFLSQAGFNHSILYRTNLTLGNWLTNSTVTGDGTLKTNSVPLSIFSPAKQGFIRVSTQ